MPRRAAIHESSAQIKESVTQNELNILAKLSVCLTVALILGCVTQRLKLSPIVGYLLAGVVVGPRTPGFVADQANAAQFAEIGIILLMFGVGLHFNLSDLLAVRRVALPGACVQMSVAAVVSAAAALAAGWGGSASAVIGLAVAVASTVVLTRILSEHGVLETDEGHLAVGWLIVQDLFTVLALVILPAVASSIDAGDGGLTATLRSLGLAATKVVVLVVVVLWGGKKVIPKLLEQVARTRSRELFTLAVLALVLAMASGSAWLFGVSMAMGAFLAGMVVRQSEVCHQAAADALPMRDAFAVLFFVTVGMLFDPAAVFNHPALFLALLLVILVVSPLVGFAFVWVKGSSLRAALTVAAGIAQIGEFSFILAALALENGLLPEEGRSLLVACSMVTISLNPLLFRTVKPLEAWLNRQPRVREAFARRSQSRARQLTELASSRVETGPPRAIIVGYGPVGQTAAAILKDFDVEPMVVDLNIDTITRLASSGTPALFGDAGRRDILAAAGAANAQFLLITTPDPHTRTVIVIVARELNPHLRIFVRAHYLGERVWLEEIGASEVCCEETEVAVGLAELLLREMGADDERMRLELRRARTRLAFHA